MVSQIVGVALATLATPLKPSIFVFLRLDSIIAKKLIS